MEINRRTEGRIRPCAIHSQLHRQRFTGTTVHARTRTHDTYIMSICNTFNPFGAWMVCPIAEYGQLSSISKGLKYTFYRSPEEILENPS